MMGTAIIVAVASFGFLKSFSPDLQYFSDYLTGHKNFTRAEVTQEIRPVVPYCEIVLTFVALLVTDLLQYKPVIIFGISSLICSKAMLYFGKTVLHMQIAEMFYAISKAANLGYSSYIYTRIEKESYQFATSILYISPKLGLMLSALVGQILLFFQLAQLENLLQINLVALFLALMVAFSLPSLKSSVNNTGKSKIQQESLDPAPKKFMELLWKEFKTTYTNLYLLKWCIWMVISNGLIELVLQYYAQALWSEVSGSKENIYNGLADEIHLIFSMAGSYIAGKVKVDWNKNADAILAVISILQGAFILISSWCQSLIWAYLHHAIYASMADVSVILYRTEMAQHLENFGLIFGINIFLAIILESMLTFALPSKQGLALPIRDQFSTVGWCFVVLGAVFVMKMVSHWFKSQNQQNTVQQNTIQQNTTTQEIYPVVVYSNLFLTLLALLVTDLVKYKPVIIFGTVAGILNMVLLKCGKTLWEMQLMELFYAIMKASNLAYRTYIYTQTDKNNYQYVTAVVNIMPKAGFLVSSLTAQVLLSSELGGLYDLVEIHVAALGLALGLAIFLPYREQDSASDQENPEAKLPPDEFTKVPVIQYYKEVFHWFVQEFKEAFSSRYVFKWCIWWCVTVGSTNLVTDYYGQALWTEVSGLKHNKYNAGVQAMYLLLTSTVCYSVSYLKIHWVERSDLVIGLSSVLQGAALISCAYTDSLASCYGLYILYSIIFDVVYVIGSSEVAMKLKTDVFALVFGINTFMSVLCQTGLTYLLTSKDTFALPIRLQFLSIGWMITIIGVIFFVKAVFTMVSKCCSSKKQTLNPQTTTTKYS